MQESFIKELHVSCCTSFVVCLVASVFNVLSCIVIQDMNIEKLADLISYSKILGSIPRHGQMDIEYKKVLDDNQEVIRSYKEKRDKHL